LKWKLSLEKGLKMIPKLKPTNLCTQAEQINQLMVNIKQLEGDKDAQNNKILSLKFHKSRRHDFENQHDEEKTQMRKTPAVLLIGTTNTSKIDPDELSTKLNTDKKIAYNFEETISSIENASQDHYNIICLHSLTNEINDKPVDQCVLEYDKIVQKCNEKWPEVKIELSLGTPRKDQFNNKINLANAREIFQ
jgi:hypothetical protein